MRGDKKRSCGRERRELQIIMGSGRRCGEGNKSGWGPGGFRENRPTLFSLVNIRRKDSDAAGGRENI